MQCTALCFTVLYGTVLYCTALYQSATDQVLQKKQNVLWVTFIKYIFFGWAQKLKMAKLWPWPLVLYCTKHLISRGTENKKCSLGHVYIIHQLTFIDQSACVFDLQYAYLPFGIWFVKKKVKGMFENNILQYIQ